MYGKVLAASASRVTHGATRMARWCCFNMAAAKPGMPGKGPANYSAQRAITPSPSMHAAMAIAVGAQAHVLHQAIKIFGTHALWLIVADRLGDFFQRAETFGFLTHECLNLVDAFSFDARRDIDHDQCAGIHVVFANGDQAGTASHGRADEYRTPFTEGRDDTFQIPDHDILSIRSIGRPIGIAMAACIEGDGVIARCAE